MTTKSFAIVFIVSLAVALGTLAGHFGAEAWYVPVVAAAIVGLISLCIVLIDVFMGGKHD